MLQKRKSQYGKHYRVSATISLTYLGSGITPTPTCQRYAHIAAVSTAPEAEVVGPTADPPGDAYHIAANYLKGTGRLSRDMDIHQPLLDSIVDDFRSGKTNRLILANR